MLTQIRGHPVPKAAFERSGGLTCSIPQAKVHNTTIHDNIGTEVVEYRWNIILQKIKGKEHDKALLSTVRARNDHDHQDQSYSWKGVASIGNEHACLSHCAIPHSHALDKSGCGHFRKALLFSFSSLIIARKQNVRLPLITKNWRST